MRAAAAAAAAALALWLAACGTAPRQVELLDAAVQESPLPRGDFSALGMDATRWQAMVDEVEQRGLPIDQMFRPRKIAPLQ